MPGKRGGNVDLRIAMAESEVHASARQLADHDATCFECRPEGSCPAREGKVRVAVAFVLRLGELLRERDAERIRRDRRDGTAGRKVTP